MKALLVNSGPLSVRTGTRVAAEPGRLVKKARDVLARDPEVGADLHALVAEVVGHGEKLDAAAAGQAVTHEVHAPDLVDGARQLQRHALGDRPLGLSALAHRQTRLQQTQHPFVVHVGEFGAQQVVDAPVNHRCQPTE